MWFANVDEAKKSVAAEGESWQRLVFFTDKALL
jgi:hypothetical protein